MRLLLQKNFDLVKSFGADVVYSYSDPESPSKIKGAYPTLAYALDTVSEGDTTKNVVESLGEKATGKRVIRLLPGDGGVGETDVRIEFIVVYTVLGKSAWGIQPRPEDEKRFEEWLQYVPSLIASGKIRSNPIWSQKGGLEKVPEGLDLLRSGKVSGQKVTFEF